MTLAMKFFSQCINYSKTRPIHSDIQFKRLSSNFSSIYTLNSQAIGFEFLHEDGLDTLAKIFENERQEVLTGGDGAAVSKESLDFGNYLNTEKEIYFLCCLETKLDKQTKRGAILKSVSIGTTKLVNLAIFKPLALFLLEEIFKIHTFNINDSEKLGLVKTMIETAYSNFNLLGVKR
jgi:hypothetical protein